MRERICFALNQCIEGYCLSTSTRDSLRNSYPHMSINERAKSMRFVRYNIVLGGGGGGKLTAPLGAHFDTLQGSTKHATNGALAHSPVQVLTTVSKKYVVSWARSLQGRLPPQASI